MWPAVGVVEEIQRVPVAGLPHHLAVLGDELIGGAVDGLAVPDARHIIGITDAGTGLGGRRQLTSVLPRESPTGAIVVTGGVADGIIGDALPVVGGQQVQPVAVLVGVGVGGCPIGRGADVAVGVIGVGPAARIAVFGQQLSLLVVGVSGVLPGQFAAADRLDVPDGIIGVIQRELRKAGAAGPLDIVDGRNLRRGLAVRDVPVGVVLAGMKKIYTYLGPELNIIRPQAL